MFSHMFGYFSMYVWEKIFEPLLKNLEKIYEPSYLFIELHLFAIKYSFALISIIS